MTPNEIIVTIAGYYKVSPDTILSTCHEQHIVKMKHIAIYCMKKTTKLSLLAIANSFGLKTHAAALFAIRSVNNQRWSNKKYAAEVADVLSYVWEVEAGIRCDYETEKI